MFDLDENKRRWPCWLGGHRFTERVSGGDITIAVRTMNGDTRFRDVEIRQCDRCPAIKVGSFGRPPYHMPVAPPSLRRNA